MTAFDASAAAEILASVNADAAAICAHPAFPDIARRHVDMAIRHIEAYPALARLSSEEAHRVIGGVLSALHRCRDVTDPRSGATLTRVQAFAARYGVCSPNRVKNMINMKLQAGYWRHAAPAQDRRIKRLEPTEKGEALHMLLATASLSLVSPFAPDMEFLALLADDPDFAGRYAAEGINIYAAGARVAGAIPETAPFLTHVAGRQVMLKLWQELMTLEEQGDRSGVVRLPFQEVTAAFGVSRPQVRRMVDAAEASGLLRVLEPGGRALQLLPPFVSLQVRFTSVLLAFVLNAARRAASYTGRGRPRWIQD